MAEHGHLIVMGTYGNAVTGVWFGLFPVVHVMVLVQVCQVITFTGVAATDQKRCILMAKDLGYV